MTSSLGGKIPPRKSASVPGGWRPPAGSSDGGPFQRRRKPASSHAQTRRSPRRAESDAAEDDAADGDAADGGAVEGDGAGDAAKGDAAKDGAAADGTAADGGAVGVRETCVIANPSPRGG